VRVVFYYAEKPRERILQGAFAEGVKVHDDEFEARLLSQGVVDCDVAVMVGVKSRELFQTHWKAGTHTVLLDKGYHRATYPGGARGWIYWRVAVNAHQCTAYLSQNRPSRTCGTSPRSNGTAQANPPGATDRPSRTSIRGKRAKGISTCAVWTNARGTPRPSSRLNR